MLTMMMTREQFVQLCTQIIQQSRDEITIVNQLDGYKKYHREMKENKYIEKVRDVVRKDVCKNGLDPINQQRIIQKGGIAMCGDMASYLVGQLLLALKDKRVEATLRIIYSVTHDHAYAHILIRLAGEKKASLWEIDSWHPRLIDISRQPDGRIKNEDKLTYGTCPRVIYETQTQAYHPYRDTPTLFKAKPGYSKRSVTPEKNMLRKHAWLYSNHTLDKAYANDELDSLGEICEPQHASFWQKC